MRRSQWALVVGLASLIIGYAAWANSFSRNGPGMFYLVGMGTAPDLITLRAIEAVGRADIIVLHDPQGKEDWADYIGDKEVWVIERFTFLLLGVDPDTLDDPAEKALALQHEEIRRQLIEKMTRAVREGKTVAVLEGGDPMMYGVTWYLEKLPEDVPSEVIPGIGAFQAASAAVKRSTPYGWDTNSVILTMDDWEGRTDTNEKLMALQTSMVFYTMHMDFPRLFEQLGRHYPADTPVAVVCYAGDRQRQKVIRSTVGGFFQDVDLKSIPLDKNMLMVGKFLDVGQARKDGLRSGRHFMEMMRYSSRREHQEHP
ncbi:MAG: hypothetical protein GXY44_01180 [Phycisphaerales bacterium]|nr:hypothetical protein [Phycisphaerales bacterium]